MLRELVALMKRVLVPDSPETLGCATNLAAVLGMTGQLVEATAICRETLDAKRRVLGPDHIDTLGGAINLGGLLTEQVRWRSFFFFLFSISGSVA